LWRSKSTSRQGFQAADDCGQRADVILVVTKHASWRELARPSVIATKLANQKAVEFRMAELEIAP